MATIQEVNSSIMFGDFTNDQLDSIIGAIKFRRSQVVKQTKRSMTLGSQVKFVHPKTGRTHIGVVTKIKIKNISVREGNTNWNVPANMLETV
jgi:hypothetical protein